MRQHTKPGMGMVALDYGLQQTNIDSYGKVGSPGREVSAPSHVRILTPPVNHCPPSKLRCPNNSSNLPVGVGLL